MIKCILEGITVAEDANKMDLRCVKTDMALDIAIRSLLEKRNFGKITVSDICTSALISRAAFYARYTDKYDFLKNWLTHTNFQGLTCDMPYEYLEKVINEFVFKNKAVIKNMVNESDQETQDILFQIVLSFLKSKTHPVKFYADPARVVFHSIYVGGLVSYIFWQAENNFPPTTPPMNKYLYKIIAKYHEIETE